MHSSDAICTYGTEHRSAFAMVSRLSQSHLVGHNLTFWLVRQSVILNCTTTKQIRCVQKYREVQAVSPVDKTSEAVYTWCRHSGPILGCPPTVDSLKPRLCKLDHRVVSTSCVEVVALPLLLSSYFVY